MLANKLPIALCTILSLAGWTAWAEDAPATPTAASVVSPAPSPEASPVAAPKAASTATAAESALSSEVFDFFAKEEEVVTASRHKQTLSEAPANIKVITREQLKMMGARRLSDVLMFLPGVQILKHKSGGEMVWIRGTFGVYNDKTLLLIDGHPFKELEYGQHPIDEQISLADVERIELIKGPGSSVYGSNAFTGVINVITVAPKGEPLARVSGGGGSFNTTAASAVVRTQKDALGVVASGNYYRTDGAPKDFDEAGTFSGTQEAKNALQARVRATWKELTVGGSFQDYSRTYFMRQDTRPELMNNHTSLLDLDWQHSFADLVDVSFSSYYNVYDYTRDNKRYNANGSLNRIQTAGEKTQAGGASLQGEWKLPANNSLLTAADYEANWGFDLRRYQWLTTVANPVATIVRDSDPPNPWLARYGLALEDTWAPLEQLHFTAGYRMDSDTRYQPQHNFRAAVNYLPTEQASLKLLWGTAYRIPSIRESYIYEVGGAPDSGNADLNPERIETAEADLELKPLGWLRLAVAGYRNVMVGVISPIPGVAIGTYQNLGNLTTYGIEPELTLAGPWGTQLDANYTHQNSFDDYGNVPGAVVNEMYNVGAQIKLPYIGARIDWHHSGVRATPVLYQYTVAPTQQKNELDPYDVANVILTTNSLPAEFQLGLYNAFDATYYDPDHLEGKFDRQWARRTIFGEVNMEF